MANNSDAAARRELERDAERDFERARQQQKRDCLTVILDQVSKIPGVDREGSFKAEEQASVLRAVAEYFDLHDVAQEIKSDEETSR